MAANDFRVWNSPHGGHVRIQEYPLNAEESFLTGEPVRVDADGNLAESGDDPVEADLLGIAAAGGDTTATTGTRDWRTDAVIAAGAMVGVVIPDHTTYFITSNFATDGAGTLVAPALTNIGDEAGFTLATGVYSVDVGATNNVCRIVDVLNADYNSIVGLNPPGGTTGVHVVFQIVAHQGTHVTVPSA